MADLESRGGEPLPVSMTPSRRGRAIGAAGVSVARRPVTAAVRVVARRGQLAALEAAVAAKFGGALPAPSRRGTFGGLDWSWAGPERWTVLADGNAGALADTLGRELAGLASVVDLVDAYVVLRVSGPKARDALAKGVTVDLHARAFGPGSVALTMVSHIFVQLAQVDAAPTYEIAVARSLAGSFWHWLEASAAEYGLDVLPPVSSAAASPA